MIRPLPRLVGRLTLAIFLIANGPVHGAAVLLRCATEVPPSRADSSPETVCECETGCACCPGRPQDHDPEAVSQTDAARDSHTPPCPDCPRCPNGPHCPGCAVCCACQAPCLPALAHEVGAADPGVGESLREQNCTSPSGHPNEQFHPPRA